MTYLYKHTLCYTLWNLNCLFKQYSTWASLYVGTHLTICGCPDSADQVVERMCSLFRLSLCPSLMIIAVYCWLFFLNLAQYFIKDSLNLDRTY